MADFIEKVLIGNFKRIPYFFETKPAFPNSQHNYALIGKLSTSLLHDILTPLCSLSLTTDIHETSNMNLLKPLIKNSTAQIQEYVDIMKNFLTDTDINSPIHVNAEISKCILLLRHKALEHGVQIQFIEFDQIYSVMYPLHIYQIVINLLSNAIEASVKCDIKKVVLIVKKDNSSFYIECKDFGSGMDDEVLRKIGRHNFSTKSANRGFGLYSVKHIVTRVLKGKLNVQSEPQSGSLFSCKLPLLK